MSENQPKSVNKMALRIVYVVTLLSIAIVTSVFIQLSHPEQKGLVSTVIPYSCSFALGTIGAFLVEKKSMVLRVTFFAVGVGILIAIRLFASYDIIKIVALFSGCYWGGAKMFATKFEEDMKKIK